MRTEIHRTRQVGFSLVEVMIAVVVLAVGLLALAALQARLASNSADAKARSRVASLLTSIIDDQRAAGYSALAAIPATSCPGTPATSLETAICATQRDAGISSLQVSQAVGGADFKQITLTGAWKDAANGDRSLKLQTIFGDVALKRDTTLVDNSLVTSRTVSPVAHQLNLGNVDGVVPIAIGDNSNAASSNPQPTVSSSGANSTKFNTLNYTQGVNDTAATSTIQKRIETQVAECVCQGSSSNPFGASDDTLYGHNTFRPTYWNGTNYIAPEIVANGVPRSRAAADITQSPECDICCRDHSDAGIASDKVRYDPVTGDTNRYRVATTPAKKPGDPAVVTTPISLAGSVGSRVAADTTADAYLDSCRVIRVDGLWRVATDIQASHLGLIATKDEMGSGTPLAVPDSAKQTSYTTFVTDAVKAYLAEALPTAGSPDWLTFLKNTLSTLFGTAAPNVPTPTPVLASTDGTYRYLHARGLYIDHLEKAAIDKLNSVMSGSCPASATNFPQCLLAYLPFSTVNVGGLAAWTSEGDSVDAAGNTPLGKSALQLGQGTNSSSTCTTGTFFGGCVTGLNSGYAYATATIGHSNSGIANSIQVSPYEEVATNRLTAAQQFNVSNTSSSDLMYAKVTGPDFTPTGFGKVVQFPNSTLNSAINTAVTWNTNGRSGNCTPNSGKKVTSPNPYSCNSTVTLTVPTTITVSGYNQAVAGASVSGKDPCGLGGSRKNTTYPIPGLVCYRLKQATLSTDSAGLLRIDCALTPFLCYTINSPTVGGTSKTASESTAITIGSVIGSPVPLSNTYLNLEFEANGSVLGTVDTSSCATYQIPTITTPTTCP